MKTIQKITLALLTMVSVSSLSAATLLLDTAAGDAEMAGQITGTAKKISANQLTISNAGNDGSLTAFEIAAGKIYCSVDGALGNAATGSVIMNGGDLETAPAVTTVPPLVMSAPGTVRAGNNLDLAATSGAGLLTLTGVSGTEVITLADMACTGGITSAANPIVLNATSDLHSNACAFDAVTLASGGTYGGDVTASEVDATAANTAASSFNSLTTTSLNIGDKRFSQNVIVG
jgi:hypothetical protein